MSDTYELWSWSEQHQCWLAVSQGTESEVMDGAVRRTDAARKYGLWGAAFVCCKVGARPHGSPAELGVDVVTEPKKAGVAPAGDQVGELERLRGIEQRARDFLERPGISSAEAIATARYIVTGDPGA